MPEQFSLEREKSNESNEWNWMSNKTPINRKYIYLHLKWFYLGRKSFFSVRHYHTFKENILNCIRKVEIQKLK